ncbi:MAG: hypothetical protein PHI85_08610 [Victivallaceae bacterium]|nr:hypothetical protein [Victivallaceae bacterium]
MKKMLALLTLVAAVFAAFGADLENRGGGRKIAVSDTLAAAVTPEAQVEFEWKCDFDFPVRYTAFSFTRKGDNREFFIFFGDTNAVTWFLPGKWYTVRLPLTGLKSLSNETLKPGDEVASCNFWIENNEGHEAAIAVRGLAVRPEGGGELRLDAEAEPIRVWPRTDPIPVKTGKQFMFVELPPLAVNDGFTLVVSGCTVLGSPRGSFPALPPDELTVHPEKINYNSAKNCVEMSFPAGKYSEMARIWVPLLVDMGYAKAERMNFSVVGADGAVVSERSFHVRKADTLGVHLKKVPVAVWYFTGLEEKYVPDFVEQLALSGVNSFYAMDGELVGGAPQESGTVHDFAMTRGYTVGTAFFASKFMEFTNGASLVEMLDNPEWFKRQLQDYLLHLSGGKAMNLVVYDAETGAIKSGDRVVGDLSDYGFGRFQTYTSCQRQFFREDLTGDARGMWITFNCAVSNLMARLSGEAVRELWPDAKFMVYSGYEYDYGKKRDMTRERYAVDWRTMGDQNIDFAAAGYQGAMDEISHMNAVLDGRVKFMPAEAYMWGFDSNQTGSVYSGRMKIRLVEAWLNSGMHGLSIWQAHVLDPSALEAIAGFTRFAGRVEALAGGRVERGPAGVSPEKYRQNVYILRNGGRCVMAAVNPSAEPIQLEVEPFTVEPVTVPAYDTVVVECPADAFELSSRPTI